MEVLLGSLSELRNIKFRRDDDAIDRLNHEVTGAMLLAWCVLVTMRGYVGDPISCWSPTEFTEGQRNYVNTLCYVRNTYPHSFYQDIPREIDTRENQEIHYYQWVPFFLFLQALMYYVPCFFWRRTNNSSPIDIDRMVQMAKEAKQINPQTRQAMVDTLVKFMNDCLQRQKLYKEMQNPTRRVVNYLFCGNIFSRKNGNFVATCYIIHKNLYIINNIGQLYLVQWFVGADSAMWGTSFGWEKLKDMFSATRMYREEGTTSMNHFPTITYCDIQVRVLGQVHRHTIQCLLQINIFNEKIFLLIWLWTMMVLIVSIVNLCFWLSCLTICQRIHYVKKYLKITDAVSRGTEEERRRVIIFIQKYLRKDGFIVIRLINANCGEMMACQLVSGLWDEYMEHYKDWKDSIAIVTSQMGFLSSGFGAMLASEKRKKREEEAKGSGEENAEEGENGKNE